MFVRLATTTSGHVSLVTGIAPTNSIHIPAVRWTLTDAFRSQAKESRVAIAAAHRPVKVLVDGAANSNRRVTMEALDALTNSIPTEFIRWTHAGGRLIVLNEPSGTNAVAAIENLIFGATALAVGHAEEAWGATTPPIP